MNRNNKRVLYIICFFIFIFTLLWLIFSYVTSNSHFAFFTWLSGDLLLSLLITSLIIIIFLISRYNSLIRELNRSFKKINNSDNDKHPAESKRKTLLHAIFDISYDIGRITKDIQKQIRELNERSAELDRKNTKLNNAYKQLETSYAQLQALMEQLKESEQRYHSLVINIPDIVLTLDSHGRITFGNRACRDILNFRRHDIVGKPFQCFIHDDYVSTFNYGKLKQLVQEKGEQIIQIPLKRKNGTIIQTEIKFTPALESRGSSIQAIIRDVTEQKLMENKLVENNRRLEIINGFSQKISSALELPDIYRTCVKTLTELLGFYGAIYFMAEKKDKFYRIAEYSGDYFKQSDSLKYFSYIHRDISSLYNRNKDGTVLGFNTFVEPLIKEHGKIVNIPPFEAVYIQELKMGDTGSGLLLVITNKALSPEEFDILRSIGNTAAVAVENSIYLTKSKNSYVATFDALITAVEARDQYTRGHLQRVSAFAVRIAKEMGMNKEQIEELRIAGILHDVGKIGISDKILLKKGPLTKEEYEEIKKHPAISNKILHPIGLSDRILKAIAFHHERFDGRGYPFGLSNESLGPEPQIIAVADAFDAMTSKRPYREPWSVAEAIRELEANKGSQFHPDIVDVMLKIQRNRVKPLI
ncbi:MAG: HD domain-containing protein [Clostridiaceae bacterium]|nr:HD domain-containing protein [Clostridiaceae bacterium]